MTKRPELIEILRTTARQFYDHTCAKCGDVGKHVQLDHIFPQSIWKERQFDPDNVQLLCGMCNTIKGQSVVDYRTDTQKTAAHQMNFRLAFLRDVSAKLEHQKFILDIARKVKA